MHTAKENIAKNLTVSFSEAELKNMDNYSFVVFKDLLISSKNNSAKHADYISGRSMPIFFSDKYFHMIIDRVCIMEYAKTIFDDIGFEFIIAGFPIVKELKNKTITNDPNTFFSFIDNKFFNHNEFVEDKNNNYNYFKDIYNLYAKNTNRLTHIYSINLMLEECIFFIEKDSYLENLFNEDKELFINYMFGDATRLWLQSDPTRRWESIGLKMLRNTLKAKYGSYVGNKKIYVSRKDYTIKYQNKSSSAPSADRVYEKESFVEDIFNKQGFSSVTLEGMSFEQQYILFNSASHIAGYTGSNLLNIALCNNNLTVYEILGGKKQHWEYQRFSQEIGHNHLCLREDDIISSGSI